MGKRKDRILAAISNAGRRVKLDLSAEPSGDLGGSSVHDEVGKDTESKERAGLPKSPSSSGHTPENPLLLLGQYSDEEIGEESNERLQQAVAENLVNDDNQVKGHIGEGSEDKDVNSGAEPAAQEVNQQENDGCASSPNVFQKPEVRDAGDSHATTSGHVHKELNLAEQTSVAGTPVQVIGDVSSGWKMVLHEESNQYYYWNIETGETSWEVPQVLVQTADLTFDQKTSDAENTQAVVTATQHSDSTMSIELDYYSTAVTIGGSVAASMIYQSKDVYECGPQMNKGVEGSESEVPKYENGATGISQIELSSTRGAADAFSGDGSLTVAGPEMYMHGSVSNEENEPVFDLSSGLVKRCENLLDKLKSLEGSKGCLQGHDWVFKYVLEVEIRLSDLKSLLSYGSSLLPFWLHSERQIKRLEGAINEEIYQLAKSQVDEVMATHGSCRGEDELLEKGLELQTEENQHATFSSPLISDMPSKNGMLTAGEKDLDNEASSRIVLPAEKVISSGSPTRQLENGPSGGEQTNGMILLDESIHEPGFHVGEDVDMDVDMEVEDSNPAGNTSIRDPLSAKDFTLVDQVVQPNPPAEHPSLPSEDASIVPPPPDEEWIPPPPPDNEQVPPPPPDDPPESSYIPTTSYMETGQPLSYTEQYNLPYSDSSFTYYGQTTGEVPSSNFYGNAAGSQVDVTHVPVYYGVVPNTYSETASVMVNPAHSVAYYGLQVGTLPSVPVGSGVESFQMYHESGPVSDNTLVSDQIGSIDAHSEAAAAVMVDMSSVSVETDMGSLGVPSTSATIQAPASISVKESVSANAATSAASAATSAASAATTSLTTKVQSKARNKKRTVAAAPSLRSNKKVSSLVDKWKAAKEELNENEEDEPENAYEILEKKRRREIEEWHAQQIASGEAKDNANFQPLGGDWREKVKRRRVQAAKEAAENQTEAQTDGNKQPNLVDLSKDLPSGWQAYWDETSKQVYYGNTITSETTWTRPKK